MPLVWIDVETTGLAPERDKVLEIAAIITDDHFNEIARWQHVLHHPQAQLLSTVDPADDRAVNDASDMTKIDPYVIKMHLKNGLWAECAKEIMRADGPPVPTVGRRGLPDQCSSAQDLLSQIIAESIPETGPKKGPQLAGSTVSFDRSFLQVHMPKVASLLSYRNLDVTSLNELARRFWKATHDARPRASEPAHRAMADIEESLRTATYYTRALAPLVMPAVIAEFMP